ncbi:hypothetical protein F4801DRAFT_584686 [Xylaria longipes]|nr:hypothetical protein F4801DRAFT_584686 [Xylaria longipes]
MAILSLQRVDDETLSSLLSLDMSVGRLVISRYLDYLPLLGAFVIAGNNFTFKHPCFELADLSSDIITE